MHTGPAAAGASAGTSFRLSNTTGITVITRRIRMAPLKAGVMRRRRRESRMDTRSWNRPQVRTSAASVPKPPCWMAITQKGMDEGEG